MVKKLGIFLGILSPKQHFGPVSPISNNILTYNNESLMYNGQYLLYTV